MLDDGSGDVDVTNPPSAPTLASRLTEGVQLFIEPARAGGFIDARQMPLPWERVWLRVTGGAIWLSAMPGTTSKARLDWMQVRFAEVPLFDSGVTLTNLRVTAEPAIVALDAAQLRTTLVVSGSWRGPGGAVTPFESQRFEDVPITLSLSLDDDGWVNGHFRLASRQVPTVRLDGMLETGMAALEGIATQGSPVIPTATTAPQ